jgi:hypothetical protein
MALHTYSLFLLRETARGSFVDDLQRAGLVQRVSEDLELLGLRCGASIGQVAAGITSIELVPNVSEFDRFLTERGNELVRWLWRAMEETGLLHAFIPSGDDTKTYVDGVLTTERVWTQLPELVETGTVRVAHPLMVFAERLGHGRPCERVKALDWGGVSQYRAGIGCVIAVTSDETERGFEILEIAGMEPPPTKTLA